MVAIRVERPIGAAGTRHGREIPHGVSTLGRDQSSPRRDAPARWKPARNRRRGSVRRMDIRIAGPADLAAINDIYNHYVLHSTCTYQYEPSTIEERQAWFAEHDEAHP